MIVLDASAAVDRLLQTYAGESIEKRSIPVTKRYTRLTSSILRGDI